MPNLVKCVFLEWGIVKLTKLLFKKKRVVFIFFSQDVKIKLVMDENIKKNLFILESLRNPHETKQKHNS